MEVHYAAMFKIDKGAVVDSPHHPGDTLVIPATDSNGKPVVEIRKLNPNTVSRGFKAVIIPDTIKIIGERAFSVCENLTEIHIPASVESIAEGFAEYCPLTKITVDPNNKFYDSRNDCNAVVCKKTNTLIQGCCNTVIPEGVKVIGHSSFQGCGRGGSQFRSLAIPKSVTKISDSAFYDCNDLENILIPSGVREIGERAFSDCSSLALLHLPESVRKIGTHAFESCSKLRYLRIPCKAVVDDEAFFYMFSRQIVISTCLTKAEELIQRFPDYMKGALFAIDGEDYEFLDMEGVIDRAEQEKKNEALFHELSSLMKKRKKSED